MVSTKISKVYKHGLPFSQSLAGLLDEQKKRVYNKKASLIIVDGGVGQGKTTLAVQIADYIEGQPISFKDQIALGGKDFVKKLYRGTKKGYKVIVYDESGDFDKKGAISRFNRMLNRIFDTYRTFEIIIILVLPSFKVLEDSLFAKKIPRILVNAHNRKTNYGDYRVYSLFNMYRIKDKMKKIVVTPQAYNLVTPNIRGHFKDLESKRSKALHEVSTAAKQEILEEFDLVNDGLLTYKNISSQLNMSATWVKQKVSELNIEHEKIYKSSKYFKDDVLDVLEKHIERGSGRA